MRERITRLPQSPTKWNIITLSKKAPKGLSIRGCLQNVRAGYGAAVTMLVLELMAHTLPLYPQSIHTFYLWGTFYVNMIFNMILKESYKDQTSLSPNFPPHFLYHSLYTQKHVETYIYLHIHNDVFFSNTQ